MRFKSKKGYSFAVQLRITEQTNRTIETLAVRHDTTKTEIMRRALELGLAQIQESTSS